MRTLFSLLAFVFVLAFAGQAHAQGFIIDEGDGAPTPSAGDSSVFALENRTGDQIVLNTGVKDTSAWFDLRSKRFPECNFAGQPLILISVEANMASGDSLDIQSEWSQTNDETQNYLGTVVQLIGASPQSAVLMTCDTHALSPALGFRYVRFIVADDDVSRTAPYPDMVIRPIFITTR